MGCVMNDWDRLDYICELSAHERDVLTWHGEDRFIFYRRKGHDTVTSYECALAWQRNMAEQKARRIGHDTGAER